jgi:hypothetical protein
VVTNGATTHTKRHEPNPYNNSPDLHSTKALAKRSLVYDKSENNILQKLTAFDKINAAKLQLVEKRRKRDDRVKNNKIIVKFKEEQRKSGIVTLTSKKQKERDDKVKLNSDIKDWKYK